MSTSKDYDREGKKSSPTFAAAICASKPLAIDLGENIDPPLFGAYQTEPGYYTAQFID